MKRIVLVFSLLFFSSGFAFSQIAPIDEEALLQSIEAVIEDTAKVKKILVSIGSLQEKSPLLSFKINQKLLVQARKTNDKKVEAYSLASIGYSYRMMGNTIKSLEFALQAVQVAQESGDTATIMDCTHDLAHNYKDQGLHEKAISMYKWVEQTSFKQNDFVGQTLAFMNLGEVYLNKGELDSALTYSQSAYDLMRGIKYSEYLCSVLGHLGRTHSSMGNDELAVSYFNMALEGANKLDSPRYFNRTYNAIAQHYLDNAQPDSALVYAKKALDAVQNNAFSNLALKPAKLLSILYRTTNSDSTLKYQDIYIAANDSLYNQKNIQQMLTLTFENELKQQEIEAAKEKEKQQRKLNIQFALIGLGIISFIIIFLLLSRSFITNTRLISFLGVVALLIVFEFLNLLLHPFLERVTHHSPLLMLLALVCIAAMLVPLHHRIEKWATNKLVEKNKQIRLAAAKRTIEQLEKDTI
jgi:tetratricopeptide (TPR) repeat protein